MRAFASWQLCVRPLIFSHLLSREGRGLHDSPILPSSNNPLPLAGERVPEERGGVTGARRRRRKSPDMLRNCEKQH